VPWLVFLLALQAPGSVSRPRDLLDLCVFSFSPALQAESWQVSAGP
jgi:hypothetical protein